jgi:DNA-directed RNA polymerase subunit M/transcription elongation factor TFIIS
MKEGFVHKRCPKCGGNVYLDRDVYGWYEQCLQCSYMAYLESIIPAREKVNQNNPNKAGGSAQAE